MLVKAKLLRELGRQLSSEELAAHPPLVGRLRLCASPFEGRDGRGHQTCLLLPKELNQTEPLVQLHNVRISIDQRGIRIEGKQDHYRRKERHTYDQVLWCKPIWPRPVSAIDPIDLGDEQAAYRQVTSGL